MKLLHLRAEVADNFVTRCAIVSLLLVGILSIANSRVEAGETLAGKTAAVETQRSTASIKLRDLKQPAKTIKEWLAQSGNTPSTAAVKVTGVKLERAEDGLDITLETADGKPLQVDATKFRAEGNNLIADIPNAVLSLPDAQEFSADNPTGEIARVRIMQTDAATIRVSVGGTTALPKSDVTLKVGGLAYSLNAEGQAPEEELVVTGEGQGRYRVPNASTATRTDTPLRDVPQSIQVIPQQVIEDQKVFRISDAVRNVSGVSIQGDFGATTDAYNIRGFTTDSLRNGFGGSGGNFVNPTNIERIEVLKGPASVLYGQLEPGGVVNYITKQPLSKPYYSAEFTAGSFSTYRSSIDLSGPLNSDKTLLYRLNAAYENSGSFIDFVHQKIFAIAPVLTFKISDRTALTLEYEYLNVDSTFYDALLYGNPISFKVPIRRFLGEPNDRYGYEVHTVVATINHRFNENLRLRSAFSTTLQDTTNFVGFRPSSLASDGRTVLRRFAADGVDGSYSRYYSFQTDLISDFSTGSIQHQLLLGFEWSKFSSSGSYLRSSIFTTPSIDLFNPVYGASRPPEFDEASEAQSSNSSTIGLYLQDQVTLLPNLKLLVGGRYDFIRNKSRNQPLDSRSQDPIGDATTDGFYDEAFSPRVGIVYQPIPPISLYASYSRSFVPNDTRDVNRSNLPPSRGTQYEVGIKADLTNRLSATLAAYEITKTNVATTDPNNIDFSIAAGEVKSRGIEFDVSGEILPGWNVIASTFINHAFVSKDNALPVGDTLVNTPRVGASLWTTYEIQDGNWKGFGLGGGIFFVGDREVQLPNTFEIPSSVRLDATIFYRRDHWKVGLNFKNITSTRDYETQYLRPSAPFTVLGSISVNF